MVDTKYPISGSVRVWWLPLNGLANAQAPTAAEIEAGMDISDAISWNDKDFGVQASSTTSDPAITAKGNTQNRGAAQYGGSLSFYYPGTFGDDSNLYSLVWDALRVPGTAGWIVVRVDGLELGTPAGTAAQPGTDIAAGDLVNVFRVETGGYSEEITGEEAFRYTISFLAKGEVYPLAVVRSTAGGSVPVVAGDAAVSIGSHIALSATLEARKYTRGLKWASSDPAVATVSRNAVVTPLTAGSVDITATDPATGKVSTAHAVTVSA